MNNGNGTAGASGTPAAALVATQTHSEPLPPAQDSTALTSRELDVAREVARGKSDREIGRALGITWITARNHLANIRAKLGMSNRTQIALHYQRLEYLNALAPTIGLTPAEAREWERIRRETPRNGGRNEVD